MPSHRALGALACALALAGALVADINHEPSQTASASAVATSAALVPGGWYPVSPAPTALGAAPAAAPGTRCGDAAGTWLGMRWRNQLRWRVNGATIPAYLGDRDAALATIRSAALNVDRGRNDCGLPEGIGLGQRYIGDTGRRAGVTADGGCAERDGQSVVSFGSLRPGLLAVTCIWWYGSSKDGGGRSVEADILVDDAQGMFFLSTPAGCEARWDLESTLTHEFGHAFGLGHVSYTEHGSLTMSDGLPDCTSAYRGLGLGDYVTLKSRYGAG